MSAQRNRIEAECDLGAGLARCPAVDRTERNISGASSAALLTPINAAIDDPDSILFVENLPHTWLRDDAPETGRAVSLGKACIARGGRYIIIVSHLSTRNEALAARDAIDQAGIAAEIIDRARFRRRRRAPCPLPSRKTAAASSPTRPSRRLASAPRSRGRIEQPRRQARGTSRPSRAPLRAYFFSKRLEDAYAPAAKRIVGSVI